MPPFCYNQVVYHLSDKSGLPYWYIKQIDGKMSIVADGYGKKYRVDTLNLFVK